MVTSKAAFCRLDCDRLNVNASFHAGDSAGLFFLGEVFFFLTRFPLTIKWIYSKRKWKENRY